MYLSQMQDAELAYRLDGLSQDILNHGAHDYEFDGLCAQYDAIVDELRDRGMWSDE